MLQPADLYALVPRPFRDVDEPLARVALVYPVEQGLIAIAWLMAAHLYNSYYPTRRSGCVIVAFVARERSHALE